MNAAQGERFLKQESFAGSHAEKASSSPVPALDHGLPGAPHLQTPTAMVSRLRTETAAALSGTLLQLQRRCGNQSTVRLLQAARQHEEVRRREGEGAYVGAVEQGYKLQNVQAGMGKTPAPWLAPGEGGYSRSMQGAAGEMVEGMLRQGALSDMLLRHVAPDLSGLDREVRYWAAVAAARKKQADQTFAKPPSIRASETAMVASANAQAATVKQTGEELIQKTKQFNSFVPQGNAFFISAGRLSSMQSLLGATDNASLAKALDKGLQDAAQLMERYQSLYEKGNRRLTTEKLDIPPADNTVELAAREMTDASRDLDAKYMGFRTTVLAGEIGQIKQEYAADMEKLAKINETKEFIRNVGETVDFTMSVVRGAPAAVANVQEKVERGRASINAARNKRDIMAGKRPRYNPTYLTTDASGKMVVRNMQTAMDRNPETGEQTAMPEKGFEVPGVADVLGKIADFIYAKEVAEITYRLNQMNTRVAAVQAVIDTTNFQQKINEYRNALLRFATRAAALQGRIQERRKQYREFGTQLDRLAQVDAETRKAGLGVAQGGERYATIMSMTAGIQEMLAVGSESLKAAPGDLPAWWQSVRERRFSRPTEGELETVNNMNQQLTRFRASVSAAQGAFGAVAAQAHKLAGRY